MLELIDDRSSLSLSRLCSSEPFAGGAALRARRIGKIGRSGQRRATSERLLPQDTHAHFVVALGHTLPPVLCFFLRRHWTDRSIDRRRSSGGRMLNRFSSLRTPFAGLIDSRSLRPDSRAVKGRRALRRGMHMMHEVFHLDTSEWSHPRPQARHGGAF